jgi:trigger factor
MSAVNGCTKKLSFDFQTLDLSNEIKSALVKKQKSVNLKGFRKGKAPLAMVEKIYGPQIESDAVNSFIQNQLYNAITSEDLRVVGYPKFENMEYDAGKSMKFDAIIEIFPELELNDYSSLSFEKDKVVVTDEDIDQLKKNYLNSKAEMVEIEDEAKTLEKGDFAVFNFAGTIKETGESPDNMKGEEFLLEIGSGQFIPGFEDQM